MGILGSLAEVGKGYMGMGNSASRANKVGQFVGKYGQSSSQGGSAPQMTVSDLNNNISNQLAMMNKDKGFYGHMTVGKAKKGKSVKIIGRGE